MSQHNYVINNASGAAVRADLDNALLAIVSQNSGATAPTTVYAYMIWIDTSGSPAVMKMRDGTNATWITLGPVSAGLGALQTAGGTMTGVIQLLLGTAALPGAAFSGNTNTGIFSPGANKVSLTAGGTEMLRADFGTYLQILGNAGFLIPSGTTAQRPTGAAGILRLNTDTNKVEAYINGSWGDTNNGYPLEKVITLTDQSSTPTAPSAGFHSFYIKSDGKGYIQNSSGVETPIGSGGGGSGKNYFALANANPDFENGLVTPWTAFTTTFTGGVPGAIGSTGTTFSLSVNSVAPLSGTKDLLITKPASNIQGAGVLSGVMTLEKEDRSLTILGSFSYYPSNANFDMTGTSTQSAEIWIRDVTGTTWIQPTNYRGMNGQPKVYFSFPASAVAGNQYQVALITNQTSTLGWALECDNFSLGPLPVSAAQQNLLQVAAGTELDNGNVTGAFSIDFSKNVSQKLTLTGNSTLTFLNAVAGNTYVLKMVQDATGGRTVTWPASVKWSGGTAPTLSLANKTDIASFYYDGTTFYGAYSLNY